MLRIHPAYSKEPLLYSTEPHNRRLHYHNSLSHCSKIRQIRNTEHHNKHLHYHNSLCHCSKIHHFRNTEPHNKRLFYHNSPSHYSKSCLPCNNIGHITLGILLGSILLGFPWVSKVDTLPGNIYLLDPLACSIFHPEDSRISLLPLQHRLQNESSTRHFLFAEQRENLLPSPRPSCSWGT